MEGILGYFKNYTTSAAIEAVNGLLQLARRRARGHRNFANFQAITSWIAGGLKSDGQPNKSLARARRVILPRRYDYQFDATLMTIGAETHFAKSLT
jgi:hypothetical protein